MSTKKQHPLSIIRKKDLAELLGVSVSQLYNLDLPKQVKLGTQARGYLYRDIEKWLEDNSERAITDSEVSQ